MEILYLLGIGALGALVKEIIEDNKISLPKFCNGEMSLGIIGGLIIGGVAGYFVDGNPITAFLAGYAGKSMIENLVATNGGKQTTSQNTIIETIKKIAVEEGVDPELAVRVAKCESSLTPTAKNTNADGSIDRGLFQINSKWHPEISDADCSDIILSTQFFCRAVKGGNLSWWDASKKCWDTEK